jgi:hypothetical protein
LCRSQVGVCYRRPLIPAMQSQLLAKTTRATTQRRQSGNAALPGHLQTPPLDARRWTGTTTWCQNLVEMVLLPRHFNSARPSRRSTGRQLLVPHFLPVLRNRLLKLANALHRALPRTRLATTTPKAIRRTQRTRQVMRLSRGIVIAAGGQMSGGQ